MKQIKKNVAVFCKNASGQRDIVFVPFIGSEPEYHNGFHYDMAEYCVQDRGYEPLFSVDEQDPAWSKLLTPRAQTREQALMAIILGMKNLGFACDDNINGGDDSETVANLKELFAEVVGRILADDKAVQSMMQTTDAQLFEEVQS